MTTTTTTATTMTTGEPSEFGRPDDPDEREFYDAYDRLADEGRCDGAGAGEYRRVLSEWSQAGRPSNLDEFILSRANSPFCGPFDPTCALRDEFRRLGVTEFVEAVMVFGELHIVVKDGPCHAVCDVTKLMEEFRTMPDDPARDFYAWPPWGEHVERVLLATLPRTIDPSKTLPVPGTRGLLLVQYVRNPLVDVFGDVYSEYDWTIHHVPSGRSTGHRFPFKCDALVVAENLFAKLALADWETSDAEKLGSIVQSVAGDWLKEEERRCNAA